MTPNIIQPVLAFPQAYCVAARRLADHCYALDGTSVRLIMIPDDVERKWRSELGGNPNWAAATLTPNLAAHTLNYAAKAMNRKPFIWLENDSIPLKAGWAEALTKEYLKAGKEFMLSSDSNPPHDLVGGIGIYGPDTHWLIPRKFREWGWDRWMIKHLAPLIHRTPLIQHSYGIYDRAGRASNRHRFPRDLKIIRPDAMIFHANPSQDILYLFYEDEDGNKDARFCDSGGEIREGQSSVASVSG